MLAKQLLGVICLVAGAYLLVTGLNMIPWGVAKADHERALRIVLAMERTIPGSLLWAIGVCLLGRRRAVSQL